MGRRPSQRARRKKLQPLRNPLLEIGGETYILIDWFELEDGTLPRDQIVLERLTPRELRVYDESQALADGVAWVLPLVHERRGRERT